MDGGGDLLSHLQRELASPSVDQRSTVSIGTTSTGVLAGVVWIFICLQTREDFLENHLSRQLYYAVDTTFQYFIAISLLDHVCHGYFLPSQWRCGLVDNPIVV